MLCGTASAQQARFDDVVRNLRNPDPKVRISAVRLLRESKYPEAASPIAALVTDPVDQIQLEAIAAELSFFLVEDVPAKKRVGLLVEVRTPAQAAARHSSWVRWRCGRDRCRRSSSTALLKAVDDENAEGPRRGDLRAGHDRAAAARRPTPLPQLIKALDHYDPVIRACRGAGDRPARR